MKKTMKWTLLLLVAALMISLAGCGGADKSGGASQSAPQTGAPASTAKPQSVGSTATPEPAKVVVTDITLSEHELLLYIGTEAADSVLTASVLPEDADITGVRFESSDPGVVTVDENGACHAVGLGNAVITVTADDPDYSGSAECRVSVVSRVNSITLDAENALLYQNGTQQLTAAVDPADLTDVSFAWASSDEAVATVTADGLVTAVGVGRATVTYSALDGSGIQGKCDVLVGVQAKGLKLDEKAITLLVGAGEDLSSRQLAAVFTPEEASVFGVTWSSSNESIATVDENGKVTGVAPGKATITCVSSDPKSNGRIKAVCAVVVGDAVRGITLNGTGDRMAKGTVMKMTVVFDPVKPFNNKLTWTSSDDTVLTVDARGTVKAVGVGTAKVTCTSADGSGISAEYTITVYQPVTKLVGSTKRLVLFEDAKGTLSVTVTPEDATDKSVTWTSADPSIAEVDNNGNVTAHKAGTTTITVTANDGSKRSVAFAVVVEPDIPLDAITFTRSGYFGYYNEFAVTFKNLTRTQTITYIRFKLVFNDGRGNTVTRYYYTDDDVLTPGATRKIGWWRESGLTYGYGFKVYLCSVRFKDGTRRDCNEALIGWFS